jgi:hypothetical protein
MAFSDKPNEYFYNGLKMLLKQCNTCIQKQKAYIQQYIFHAAGRPLSTVLHDSKSAGNVKFPA